MTEDELKERWKSDQFVYESWGQVILDEIVQSVIAAEKDPDIFFKIPPKTRLKTERSLIDKAFYRNKEYDSPYDEIEDKVGVRFVVLLLDDIDFIIDLIKASETWNFDACKHFDEDREKEPLLFTYQSVHFILRPKKRIQRRGKAIPLSTPCEVQVRTLLQHAHAELTHDSIYKAKKEVKPVVHRTVAKSMALIETTDEFFSEATKQLNFGPIEKFQIVARLDGTYRSITDIDPHSQKSTRIILHEFEDLISDDSIDEIQAHFSGDGEYAVVATIIKKRYSENALYQQSVVLFVYWMLLTHKRQLLQSWPLSLGTLQLLASDIGVSLDR